MPARIWQIVVKEIIQYRRDVVLTVFIFTFPVMQLMLVANATGSDIAHLPIAVFDEDRSAVSRGIVQTLANLDTVSVTVYTGDSDRADNLLQRGEVWAVVVIPPNFAADLWKTNQPARVQVIADGSSVYGGGTVLHTIEGAVNGYLYHRWRTNSAVPPGQPVPSIEIEARMRFNAALNKRYNSIPAQFGFIVYQVTLIVSALGLVREREMGTLEQLMVTPLRRRDMLAGKAIPAVVIGFVDALLMLWVVVNIYHIPQRGTWWLLLTLTFFFILAETGWGLLISAVARSQQQALLTIFPLSMLDLALSGYLVPVENMPVWLQLLAEFSPMRHYITIVKSVMIKGATLPMLWEHAAALVGLTLLMAYLSHRFLARTFE